MYICFMILEKLWYTSPMPDKVCIFSALPDIGFILVCNKSNFLAPTKKHLNYAYVLKFWYITLEVLIIFWIILEAIVFPNHDIRAKNPEWTLASDWSTFKKPCFLLVNIKKSLISLCQGPTGQGRVEQEFLQFFIFLTEESFEMHSMIIKNATL